MIHDWAALTRDELAALDTARAVAVLPLGATEQHGPHLPLSTDTTIAEGLTAAALAHLPAAVTVLRLPGQAIGASAEHADHAGTVAVAAETLAAWLRAIGAGLAAAGVCRLVVVNGHGGNRSALDIAALDLRRAHGMRVVKVHYPGLAVDTAGLPAEELERGIHGGALETALMLHLQPAAVRLEALPPASPDARGPAGTRPGRIGPGAGAPYAWLADDLGPNGIAGDPALADAALGARLADAYARAMAGVIAATADTGPPP